MRTIIWWISILFCSQIIEVASRVMRASKLLQQAGGRDLSELEIEQCQEWQVEKIFLFPHWCLNAFVVFP